LTLGKKPKTKVFKVYYYRIVKKKKMLTANVARGVHAMDSANSSPLPPPSSCFAEPTRLATGVTAGERENAPGFAVLQAEPGV